MNICVAIQLVSINVIMCVLERCSHFTPLSTHVYVLFCSLGGTKLVSHNTCVIDTKSCVDCFCDCMYNYTSYNAVPLLLNLVNGRVPVTHLHDYVNDREAETLGLSRPQLSSNPLQPPVSLHVNLMLDDTATERTIDALVEICSHCQWVEVKLKGLNMLGLNPAILNKFQLNFNALMSPIIDHVYLTGACFRDLKEIQSISSTLWVSCSGSLYVPRIPGNCKNFLLASRQGNSQLTKALHELSIKPPCLQAFCIMQQGLHLTDTLSAALSIFLQTVSGSLEYLQLQRWSFSSTDLKSLLQCTKLRVLSITGECQPMFMLPKHRASDIFTAISELPYLEFFQWSESLNLVTADLLSLRHLLRDSLRSLNHFHIGIFWLHLSTTDLENESYSPLGEVLLPLLSGKEGSDVCSTYRFTLENNNILEWLSVLRPQVCFRVGREMKVVTELHKAATVYNHLY